MKIELKILNKEFYKCEPLPGEEKEQYQICKTKNMPTYATPGSGAIDLVATQDYTIMPGEVVEIRTGLAMWIGSDLNLAKGLWKVHKVDTSIAAIILPRSGRGAREGLVLANTMGFIDEDFQGEIVVYAMNRNFREGNDFDYLNSIEIKKGERFCQMAFIPIIKPTFEIVEEFSSKTERGEGGFGHSGI